MTAAMLTGTAGALTQFIGLDEQRVGDFERLDRRIARVAHPHVHGRGTRPPATPALPRGNHERILVVDDEAAIRRVLEANPRLEVTWFPVATPELNPQEHVWKATRRAVSHNHTHARLPELADAFEHHLTTTTFDSSFLKQYGYASLCPMFT